jgi:hypothetical protein
VYERTNVRERLPIRDWPEEEIRMAIIARMTADRDDYEVESEKEGDT